MDPTVTLIHLIKPPTGSSAIIAGLPILLGDFATIRVIFNAGDPPREEFSQASVFYLSVKQQWEEWGTDAGTYIDIGGEILQLKTFIPSQLIYSAPPP